MSLDTCLAPQGTKRGQPKTDFCIPPQGLAGGFLPTNLSNLEAWYDPTDISTITFASTSAWATSTAYAYRDHRTEGGLDYICLEAHTSGTFATDLANGLWRRGGRVSQIDDKSGNANHAVQTTASAQPYYGLELVNGKNVLTLNAGQWLNVSYASGLNPTTLSLFTLSRVRGTGNQGIFSNTPLGNNGGGVTNYYNGSTKLGILISDGAADSFDVAPYHDTVPNQWLLFAWTHDDTLGEGYIDQTSYDTSTKDVTYDTNNDLRIGATYSNSGTNLLNGDIEKIILYSDKKNSSDRTSVTDYAKTNIDTWTGSPDSVPGLIAWYDADDSDSIQHGTGTNVSQWNDKSDQANHITQGTPANQPTEESAVQNGKNVVRFNGTSDLLRRTSWTGGEIDSPNTIFVVVKPDTDTGDHRTIVDGGENDSNTRNLIRNETGTGDYQIFAGTILDSGVAADSSFVLLRAELNSTSGRLFRDGTQIGSTGDVGTRVMSGITLGAAYNDNDYSACDIAEVLVYDRQLSSYEITDIESYLTTKWGL